MGWKGSGQAGGHLEYEEKGINFGYRINGNSLQHPELRLPYRLELKNEGFGRMQNITSKRRELKCSPERTVVFLSEQVPHSQPEVKNDLVLFAQ